MSRRYLQTLVLLSGFAVMRLLWAQDALLLEKATVIRGDGALLENTSVLIENGRIAAVGSADQLVVDETISRRDLSGQYLLPALIDAHAHLGYQSSQGWGAEYYTRENLIENLQQYARYGFGAVFSAGSDPDEMALALQQELASNPQAAARPLFAIGMGPPGQGPNDAFLIETAAVEARTGMTILRGIDGPVQGIERAREVADLGIGFIKIWVDDRGGSQEKLSTDAYSTLIAEAMRQRLAVFVHQQSPEDMWHLLEVGAAGFLHGRLGPQFTSELAAATARAGAFIVPNLGLAELRRETIGRDPFLARALPASERQRLSQVSNQRQIEPPLDPEREAELRAAMSRLLEADVDIVLGTDAGALPDHPFGYTGHRELEILVRLGMSPMQALVAATGNAARHLRQNDIGLIEVGRRADLLILAANPLEDIRNTRRIAAVYLGGRLLTP
jgi:imidazolonepropionase-like amidohydrolase